MTRRLLLPFLLLLALVSLAGLAACGNDDEEVSELLAQTFGGEGEDVRSGRLDLNVRFNGEGLRTIQGPLGLQLNGPFSSTKAGQLPRFDFNLAIESGGQTLQAGAVSTGDKGFLRFQDQAYAVSEQLYEQFRKGYAEQARCSEKEGGAGGGVSFRTLGIDPRRWLRESRKEGEQDVGGAETVHITSQIDVPKFLEDVNRILGRTDLQRQDPCGDEQEEAQPEQPAARQLSAETRRVIADSVKSARMDVWTGADDKIMRRLNVQLDLEVAEKDRARANGLRRGDLRFDLTLGAVNDEQSIEAPADAKPLDDLLGQFGGQVPGLGGAGGGGATPGGAGGGGSGGAQAPEQGAGGSAYDRCAAEAAGDVRKLQECADLLGR